MALSKIQPASMDLTANYAFTGTNSVAGLEYAEKKLSTLTASSSATLDFTSSIDSTYNIYKFRFINIHPATDTASFTFNGSADSGSNYNVTKTTTFFDSRHNEGDSDSGLGYSTGDDIAQGTGYQDLSTGTGSDNDQGFSGELFLFDPSSTTFVKHFFGSGNDYSHHDYAFTKYYAGYFNTTSAINAISFKFSSGNIDSGTIEMYGIN
jgi:hypothetical protein